MFIVNMFCGVRRAGDVQDAIEVLHHSATSDFDIWVLSLGVVVDAVRGDLSHAHD